jgi:hypothetical protein
VDHVDIGPALDPADFWLGTLTSNIGSMFINPAPGNQLLDVTAYVAATVGAGKPFVDFRLRFDDYTNGDEGFDAASFTDAEDKAGVGTAPLLLLFYQL